ncbi:MAG: [FeFe] hydrogenase H-cluster maturation GTPase HydF [Clostridiaceae bacterium]
MGLNSTPNGERVHIGIFGRMNSGKSSIINAITGQSLSIVSMTPGTTTDPVYKTMEILPLGPVVIIDTPGLDDQGELGSQRVIKGYEVLGKTDIAVLVVDAAIGKSAEDEAIIQKIRKKGIPYLIVYNKADLTEQSEILQKKDVKEKSIWVSSKTMENIFELKEILASMIPDLSNGKRIIADLLNPQDVVILVVPIDSAAPKGRLILPQQQVIRDILEAGAISVVVQTEGLKSAIESLKQKPRLVVTDSQAFGEVKKIVPEDIELTSFSILMARYKGNLFEAVKGAKILDSIEDGAKILISEGCTHHRQCDDIGTVKLPKWIETFTGKKMIFEHTSGTEYKRDLSEYSLVVHCGGCMLNEKEMQSRIGMTLGQHIPITNYGILIAHMNGILERSIEPFSEFYHELSMKES